MEKAFEDLELKASHTPNTKETDFMHAEILNWKKEDRVFTSTRATDVVLKKLKSKNVVTIVGGPGCGKSMMAKHIALEYEKQGYTIHILLRPNKLMKLFSPDTKHVLMFDDPLGGNIIDSEILNTWKKLDKGIRKVLHEDNIKVIATIRSSMSNDEKVQASGTILTENLVDITQGELKLDKEEKYAMFKCHCPKLSPPEQIDDCMFDLFPLLCYVYRQSLKDRSCIFSAPFEVLLDTFKTIKDTNIFQFCGLVLCAVVKGFRNDMFETSDVIEKIVIAMGLQPHDSYPRIKTMLDVHVQWGTYIQDCNGTYQFKHSIFKDIVLYLCGSVNPIEFVFQHFPPAVLRERVRIGNKLVNDKHGEFLLILDNTKETRMLLATRFKNDLIKREYRDVFLSPYVELQEIETSLSGYINRNGSGLHGVDSNSMTILHWAVLTNFLVRCVIETGIDVNVPDSCGFTPLHYATVLNVIETPRAFLSDCWDIGNKLYIPNSTNFMPVSLNSVNTTMVEVNADVSGYEQYCALRLKSEDNINMKRISQEIDVLQILLQYGADVNMQIGTGLTALMAAADNNNIEMVKILLQNKANVNLHTRDGETAIIRAAYNNNTEMVEMLLEKGAEPNIQSTDGNAVLILAAQHNNMGMLKTLLEHNAAVNVQTKNGDAAIIFAAFHGNLDMVKILLQNNANVNLHTRDGDTAIIRAAYNNNTKMVEMLLEKGAEPNIQPADGNAALILAAQHNNMGMLKTLLEHNAAVNVQTKDGDAAIIFAAFNDNLEMVKILLQNNADVNLHTRDGDRAIIRAAYNNNTKMVEMLLEKGAEPNIQPAVGNAVLILAAQHNNMGMLKTLLEHNAAVNVQTKNGDAAIIFAAFHDNLDMVKILLQNNANVNLLTRDGDTAIIRAAYNNNSEMVEMLLEKGAEPNIQSTDGNAVLILAAQHNNMGMLKTLLEHNAAVNVQTKNGDAAIIFAAFHNNLEIVKLLLQNKADVNLRNKHGDTATLIAACHNNMDLVELLLENRSDSNYQTKDGDTAIMRAACHDNMEMVEVLIKNGADVNVQTRNGDTALIMAASHNNMEMVKMLLKAGANVNTKTYYGMEPIVLAAHHNNMDMIKILLEYFADVNAKNEDDETAIILAARHKNTEMVEILIENGADVNIQSKDGMTPIFIAAYHNNMTMVEILLEYNADVNVQTENGETAIIRASYNNNIEMITLLLENGADVHVPDLKREPETSMTNNLSMQDQLKQSRDIDAWVKAIESENMEQLKSILDIYNETKNTDALQNILLLAAAKGSKKICKFLMNERLPSRSECISGSISEVLFDDDEPRLVSPLSISIFFNMIENIKCFLPCSHDSDIEIIKQQQDEIEILILEEIKRRLEMKFEGRTLGVHTGFRNGESILVVYMASFHCNPYNKTEDLFCGRPFIIRHPKIIQDQNPQLFENKEELTVEQIRVGKQIIDENAQYLWSHHSNLNIITMQASPESDGEAGAAMCSILLLCTSKGIIPTRQNKFPKTLSTNDKNVCLPVHVEEGYYEMCPSYETFPGKEFHQHLKMGCSISSSDPARSGTLGPFVDINGQQGFLTCAHVLFDVTSGSLAYDSQVSPLNIFQPEIGSLSQSHPRLYSSRTSCGTVVKAVFSPQDDNSVDAAAVLINEDSRLPESGQFAVDTEDNYKNIGFDDPPVFNSGQFKDPIHVSPCRTVVKSGKTTHLTRGILNCYGTQVRSVTMTGNVNPQVFEMKNQIEVLSIPPSVFFQPGDSGSAVFQMKDDTSLECIGMAIGSTSYFSAIVTPIRAILEKMGPQYSLSTFR